MHRLRLEYRLPLLVSGIFTLLALAGTWLAYQEVRSATLSSAEDRIRAVSDELATLVAGALQQRTRLLAQAAEHPVVRAAGDANVRLDMDALGEVLSPLRAADGTPFVVAVLRGDGSAVLVGDAGDLSPPPMESLLGTDATGARYSRIFERGGRVHYWTAVPVPGARDGALLAQLRGVAGSTRVFEDLAGPDAAIYVANPDAATWYGLGSPARPLPLMLRRDASRLEFAREGRTYLARSRPLTGTPWQLIIELPQDVAFNRAHVFVRRVIGVGLLLTVAGVAAAVVVMRRLLRPVGELGAAARDIASGEYGRRVPVRDGDEIGELADAFNAMAAQVELAIGEARHSQLDADEANRAKSAFLATMSHELRTPINAVVGYTELLDLGVAGELSQQQRHYLERIRMSSQHLTRLVDEILDIARIEAGQLRIAPTLCQAADHINAACDVILPQARVQRVNVVAETTSIAFIGDPQRVEQILVNLLSNAVKFSDAGGIVTARCSVASPEDSGGVRMCRFDVSDTGCGVPAAMHEAIFEPFVQVDGSYTRSRGGAGLGLSISRQLAQLMGGRITVCSTAGRGSTFTLWLPLVPATVPGPAVDAVDANSSTAHPA